ncbi:MAG: glycerophosphoryl diester phosphodiesterase membrane domain-containing protein [Chloroflexi bacterium]|nr:glycerophosphoryl diester phosphodiesterase membrane domain-containing protein [Chloroflexota bacterium]
MIARDGSGTLQPMGMGDLFSHTVEIYRTYFGNLVAIVAPIQLALVILNAVISRQMQGTGITVFAALSGLLTLVFTVLATLLQTGALTVAIADDAMDRPISVTRAYTTAADRIGALLGTALLAALLYFVMGITIILIPLAIYFGVRWVFLPQVVMLENMSGMTALRRSGSITRGRWWPLFGVLLLTFIIIGVIGALLGGILSFIGLVLLRSALLSLLFTFLIQTAITPLGSIVITLLYFDGRARQEELTMGAVTALIP